MQQASLYVARTATLDDSLLVRLAPGVEIASKKRGFLRRNIASFSLRWPGLEATISLMPPAQRAEHLQGFASFCLQSGWSADSPLIDRVRATQLVLGVSATQPDDSGRLESLVWALARELDALVLVPPGVLFDASGRAAEEAFDNPVDDDDEVPCDPPTRERVARRALALCAVSYRSLLEADRPEGADELLRKMRMWCDDAGVRDELEPRELALLDAPLGQLPRQDMFDGTWRIEGLAVLVWYLGLAPLPAHDAQADPPDLWSACDFLQALPPRLAETARPRSDAERERMSSQLLGLHWRLRDFGLNPVAMDFRAFAADCWFGKMDLEGVALADDDLAIGGRPIADAHPELLSMAKSVAMERHRAIRWLDGFDPVYSQVDTST